MAVRLEWDGKGSDAPRLHLPLQVVETVNAPRADRGTIFEGAGAGDGDAWRNRLIWGTCTCSPRALTSWPAR